MKFKIQDNRTAARYRPCLHIEALWCTLTLNLLCFLERKKTRQPTQMSVFACNKAVKWNRCLSRNGAQFVFLWRAQIQSSDVWPPKSRWTNCCLLNYSVNKIQQKLRQNQVSTCTRSLPLWRWHHTLPQNSIQSKQKGDEQCGCNGT